jgi:two-component system NtrC family sensor kinase
MRFDRTAHTTQLLQLLMCSGVVLPVLLFVYAGWVNYRSLDRAVTERVERNLDVIQEHTLKVFQTVERTISETNEVLRGLSDEQIRNDEARLNARIKEIQAALPHVEAIWAFDRDGRPLVASTVLPVPQTLNNAVRD